jgi:tetratricopeptide (TPR) repeat protein
MATKSEVLCFRCYAVRMPLRGKIELLYLRSLKWIGVTLLFAAALSCVAFGVVLALPAQQQSGKTLWAAGIVFGLLGAALAWLGARAALHCVRPFRGERDTPETAHLLLGRRLWEEGLADGCFSAHKLASLYTYLLNVSRGQSKGGMEGELDDALQKAPRNPFLLCLRLGMWTAARQPKQAIDFIDRNLQHVSDAPAGRFHLIRERIRARVLLGDSKVACQETEAFLATAAKEEKIGLLDSLACLPLMEGAKDFLPEALTYAKRALEIDPGDLTLQGTYGSLLFDQGHTQEGADILRAVYERSHNPVDQGISALYLGLFAKQNGKLKQAKRFAKEATALHPELWLIERIKTTFDNDSCGCDIKARD